MSTVTDQILSDEEESVQLQIERLHEQKNANILARFQGALQAAHDRRNSLDQEVAELSGEVSSRMPQVPSDQQPQG